MKGVYFVESNDASGFAKGLKHLIGVDNREKKERSERARSYVKNRYSERRLLGDIESLYFRLLNKSFAHYMTHHLYLDGQGLVVGILLIPQQNTLVILSIMLNAL